MIRRDYVEQNSIAFVKIEKNVGEGLALGEVVFLLGRGFTLVLFLRPKLLHLLFF
jgi:hypothetical protein